MKTEEQVRAKLKEHEVEILKILIGGVSTDFEQFRLENLRKGRNACLWVLSDTDKVKPDELDKKIHFELLCHESSKIF